MRHSNRAGGPDVISVWWETVSQRASPRALKGRINPNSRLGQVSPHRAQGREGAHAGGAMAEGELMVGVDVSMLQLDVALWPSGENFSVSNDPQGVEQLLARTVQLRPQAVVIEASGGPEDLL